VETLCQATRKDGQPCAVKAGADGFCVFHSPAAAERRRAANAQGGRNKATPRRLERLLPAALKPVLVRLMDGLEQVHEGVLDPRQATAMASLAGAICKMYETAALEERLAALEAAHGQQNAS